MKLSKPEQSIGFRTIDMLISKDAGHTGHLLFQGVAYYVPRNSVLPEPNRRSYSCVKAFTSGDVYWCSGGMETGLSSTGQVWFKKVSDAPTRRSMFDVFRKELLSHLNLSAEGYRHLGPKSE